MSFWDLRRLQQYFAKHKPHSVYLLFGDEPYLIDESLSLIKQKTLEEGITDFNFNSFHAKEDKISDVLDCAEMLPMMSPFRLVVLKNIDLLKESDWKQLNRYLQNPVESCVFVLIAYGKIDKRKKFVKLIAENGVAAELKRPYENQMAPWVEYIAAQYDLQLDRDAVFMFLRWVGNNLYEVKNELLKLKQFLGESHSQVTVNDVVKIVSHSKVDSLFDLTDAIAEKDSVRALLILRQLFELGQSEIGILSLILRHIRVLATIRENHLLGVRGQNLISKAGVPSFFFKKYFQQSQKWSHQSFYNLMKLVALTEKSLKTSPISSNIWLESFIIQSCQSESVRVKEMPRENNSLF
jgi:DNA polymerase-3 subunit delta